MSSSFLHTQAARPRPHLTSPKLSYTYRPTQSTPCSLCKTRPLPTPSPPPSSCPYPTMSLPLPSLTAGLPHPVTPAAPPWTSPASPPSQSTSPPPAARADSSVPPKPRMSRKILPGMPRAARGAQQAVPVPQAILPPLETTIATPPPPRGLIFASNSSHPRSLPHPPTRPASRARPEPVLPPEVPASARWARGRRG